MISYIPIEQVVIPDDRQRQVFDPGCLNELRESIEENGLLQAIILREEAGTSILVAGHRRFLAIQALYELGGKFKYGGVPVVPGCIPYVNLGELSPLQRKRAEYEENERRVNLTWQERARATSELKELLDLEAAAAGIPGPNIQELAAARRGLDPKTEPVAATDTSKELAIVKYLDDPEVRKAPTLRDAFKLVQRREAAEKSQALGAAIGSAMLSARSTLIHADVFEWAKTAEEGQFDVVLTDPPYGMDADNFGDSGGKAAGGHFYADSYEIGKRFATELPDILALITKPQAHAYIFCDIDWFPLWRQQMEAAGWKVFRTPLIWFKPSAFRAPWPEQGPQRKYETILFAVKGGMKVTKLLGDVLSYNTDDNLGHQAQKPVDLFVDLLKRSTTPGMKVFDACAGSGTIFAAAQECKVFATGIEKDATAYGIAAKRIQDLKDRP